MVIFRTSAVAGSTVFVAGMVGRDAQGHGLSGVATQATRALERVGNILTGHGLGMSDVVRLRIYVKDMSCWPSEVLPAVASAFADVVPPAVVLQVSAFVETWMEIEIEVEACAPTIEP